MDYRFNSQRLIVGFAAAILILTGCAPEIRKPAKIRPVRRPKAQALSILNARSQTAVPLKGTGRCRLQYFVEAKKHKENFPLKIWINPPAEIYLQGDVAFNPKGIIAGSNEHEFWLAIKPKEISSYWWGQWSGKSSPQKLMISPQLVLEALGIVELASEQNWSLSYQGHFDLLTQCNESGVSIKKIYIFNNSNYLVKKIEYLDTTGRPVVVTELERYKEILENYFVPTLIKISNRIYEGKEDCAEITLSSIKPTRLTDKQRSSLFSRPQPRGYKHVYKIIDGKIIEPQQ